MATGRSLRAASVLVAVAALACGTWPADRAAAQDYPTRPIKLVVPLVPGSPGDIVARLVADKLSIALKQPLVVENRPGAAGNTGTEFIARSAPDGYTLGMVLGSTLTVNPSVYRRLPFDPDRDLRLIAVLATSGQMLTVHPSVPVNSVKDFVAYAQAATAAKQPITYGSGGVGIPGHLAMESFRVRAGFDAVHVPYRGNTPVVVDLLAGQIKFAFISSAGLADHLRAGRLKGLAVSRGSRSPLTPELPTIAESGYPGFRVETDNILLAPAGLPDAIAMRSSARWLRSCGFPTSSSACALWTWIRDRPSAMRSSRVSGSTGPNGRKSSLLRTCGLSEARVCSDDTPPTGATRVVMLGTGNPRPDPERSGPATAIVVNNTPYLVDFGPGVIRRATAAYHKGITALGYGGTNIRTVFLTHLHSDHTAGYPDLIFTPWVMGRREPLAVYGPKGIAAMTGHVLAAWRVDIEARTGGLNRHNPTGHQVDAHEIVPGIVFRDQNVTVTAFPAHHEEMADSFGFRFEAPDRVIVISGDTAPTQALIDHSRGCDVLIHEAYSITASRNSTRPTPEFRRRHHTSSIELARIANEIRPGLLVTYHRSNAGEEQRHPGAGDVLVEEITQAYRGRVVAADDLDVF